MSCRSCSDLCIRYRIGSPSELGKAIRIAFQNVQDGTLREVDPPENDSGPTFSELAQGAAWGDVVSFGFECQTCGQSFRLHAETYHGSGGYWESVTSNTIERSVQAKILIAIAAGDQEACDALFDVTCAIEDPEMKADVLNNLLVMPGHELHQQIAMEIQRLKSPSSVPYIRSVLMKGFDYLAYTCSEDGTIAKWFSHALAEIGTPEAINLIKTFSVSSNAGIAKEMKYRMSRLHS